MQLQHRTNLTPFTILSLSCLLSASTLLGQEFPSEVFLSGNENYSFTEVQSGTDVLYYVDVLSGGALGAVAFSFEADEAPSRDEGSPFGDGPGEPIGEEPGREPIGGALFGEALFAPWSALTMSETAWDAGANIQVGGGIRLTTDLGSFDSLFGLLDNHIVLFSDVLGGNDLDESNDVDGSPFSGVDGNIVEPLFIRWNGDVATNGLFFDQGGIVVGSTIPEPSSAILVGLGSAGLLMRRRKS